MAARSWSNLSCNCSASLNSISISSSSSKNTPVQTSKCISTVRKMIIITCRYMYAKCTCKIQCSVHGVYSSEIISSHACFLEQYMHVHVCINGKSKKKMNETIRFIGNMRPVHKRYRFTFENDKQVNTCIIFLLQFYFISIYFS